MNRLKRLALYNTSNYFQDFIFRKSHVTDVNMFQAIVINLQKKKDAV